MNESRDLQHPDITAAEKTGYQWFPQLVSFQLSETLAKSYCQDAFENFWAFLTAAYPYAVSSFIDDNADDLVAWMGG